MSRLLTFICCFLNLFLGSRDHRRSQRLIKGGVSRLFVVNAATGLWCPLIAAMAYHDNMDPGDLGMLVGRCQNSKGLLRVAHDGLYVSTSQVSQVMPPEDWHTKGTQIELLHHFPNP